MLYIFSQLLIHRLFNKGYKLLCFVCVICFLGEESFDASMVGEAAEVIQERISDDELILIKG